MNWALGQKLIAAVVGACAASACVMTGAGFAAEPATPSTETAVPSKTANMDNQLANWSFQSAWDKQNGYKLGVDKEITFKGQPAAYLQSQREQQDPKKFYAAPFQNFKPDKFRGKRVQFTAFLKTSNVTGGAGVWFKAKKGNHVVAFANSGDTGVSGSDTGGSGSNTGVSGSDTGVSGTSDWKKYSATMDVPENADLLTIGVYLFGGGKVWFGDLGVNAVDNSVPSTAKTWDAKKYWQFANELKSKPDNLDFSLNSSDEKELMEWACHTSPSPGKCGIDRAMMHNGKPSAFVEQQSKDPTDFVASYQDISAADYAGKRVKLSALVKTKSVTDWTALWMRVDGENKVLAFDNMEDRPIKGDTDWAPYSVILDVPADATRIRLGFMLAGSGKAWMNSCAFTVVDKTVPVTAPPVAPMPVPSDADRTTPDLEFHQK